MQLMLEKGADRDAKGHFSGLRHTSTERAMKHGEGRFGQTARKNQAVTPTPKGKTIWFEPVSDKDYNSVK
jgi:hypothetical protein